MYRVSEYTFLPRGATIIPFNFVHTKSKFTISGTSSYKDHQSFFRSATYAQMQKNKFPFKKAVIFMELYRIALASQNNALHGQAMIFSSIDLSETSIYYSLTKDYTWSLPTNCYNHAMQWEFAYGIYSQVTTATLKGNWRGTSELIDNAAYEQWGTVAQNWNASGIDSSETSTHWSLP